MLGAGIGWWRDPQRVIALVMAFGAGVLISSLTFELTEEAFRRGGAVAGAGGLVTGALAFFSADWVVDRRGGADRKRSGGEQAGGSATANVIGAIWTGSPSRRRSGSPCSRAETCA